MSSKVNKFAVTLITPNGERARTVMRVLNIRYDAAEDKWIFRGLHGHESEFSGSNVLEIRKVKPIEH